MLNMFKVRNENTRTMKIEVVLLSLSLVLNIFSKHLPVQIQQRKPTKGVKYVQN